MTSNWKIVSMGIGFFLLGLNIVGWFQTLRNPEIYKEVRGATLQDEKVLPPKKVLQVFEQPESNHSLWVRQLNEAIHQGIAHYWEDEGLDKYHLRVPWSENYILAALGYLIPKWFEKWEFFDYHKAIERGVGLCSQQSIIFLQVLAEQGIPAKMLGLSNHRIVTAEIEPGQWWILDPDYGVVIEANLKAVELDSNLVRVAYQDAGHSEKDINNMVRMFEQKEKRVEPLSEFYRERYYFEPIAYLLIWAIPFILVLPWILEKRHIPLQK